MGLVTPDGTSCVLACSVMNPGNTAQGQGIYPGCKATAVHPANSSAATLKPQ